VCTEDDKRAASRRREMSPFWDSGVLGERKADASEDPSSVSFAIGTGTFSRASESSCTGDSVGRVLVVTVGVTGFPECMPGRGGDGAAGDNGGFELGDCLWRSGWHVGDP
jgi:hypothetical protein